MFIRIYPANPNNKQIRIVADVLEQGGIIIYPTDTVYAMGCSIKAAKAIEKIAQFKGLNPLNPDLSIIFHDMSQLSEYTVIRDNNVFKLLKRNLPGPFTFIVQANNQIPRMFKNAISQINIIAITKCPLWGKGSIESPFSTALTDERDAVSI